jgi:hypothetical protein
LKRPVLAGRRVDGRVREWLGPKSRCAGCEPATLDDRDVPECPPGPALSLGAVGVDEELAVDRVADVALERADRVLLGLALGQLALEVCAALGVALADLADGGQVQGVVQPSVAPLGDTVDDPATGGRLDRGGAVVGRVVIDSSVVGRPP